MAKKTKDPTASAAKTEAKAKVAADPVATKNLIKLLNILALLLAITAFLLQFFAVITHHWKYQVTNLHPIFTADHQSQTNAYDDSRIDQKYGLYSRNVKVYANHDEQLNAWASTRFPRLDNGEDDLHQCLSQTSTLRGSLLTCADRLSSSGQCHCRRYPHWNAIIFFEIAALVLLGLLLLVAALLTTQFNQLLKLVGLALSFLAFLFLLIGLILLLSYSKRETRSIADIYPHVHKQLATQVAQRLTSAHHIAVRRQVHEKYRAYPLLPGQHPYNETHFQQYSEKDGSWVQIAYASLGPAAYGPRSQQSATRFTTQAPLFNPYGPAIGYNTVYENTRAYIGWSTVLSILALILALILPLILAFSWLKAKQLVPATTTTTTTTTIVKTEYPLPAHDITHETVPLTSHGTHAVT
jgi:hypothetical protein